MKYRLEIRTGASIDIEEAYEWYEKQQRGLGEEFLQAVRTCLERIESRPESYAVLLRNARRARLDRFPYSLYYSLYNDLIAVFACFHCSRDPEGWQDRI